jgi:hypothetical protein
LKADQVEGHIIVIPQLQLGDVQPTELLCCYWLP